MNTPADADSRPTDVGSADEKGRVRLTIDVVWKILAVLGVLLLVYLLFYLGSWLGALN